MSKRNERLLVLGCGSVAQCALPILVHDLGFDPTRIRVVDFEDNRDRVSDLLRLGLTYEIGRLTPDNYDEFLAARCTSGDILLDLAWNIDSPTIIEWCHHHGVRYLNTSVEVWDPYVDLETVHPTDRTLYVRHMELRRRRDAWQHRGPTAVVEHGANPGLVSHFAKQALTEIAARLLSDGRAGDRTRGLEQALADRSYPLLAELTGTKVIHISERDTQLPSLPKRPNEFVNTWSVEGLYEEGVAPAELGWGTHERTLPVGAHQHSDGPRNQICIARPGMETWVRSWVPSGPIHGMVIRHGEAFTISDHLTVWDPATGDARYRPTVHYAYHPSDSAIASVLELRMRNLEMQSSRRILNNEIVSGTDELGVLLMGHDYTSWWTGSILGIDEARTKVPGQSATTVQVAASVCAALLWMCDVPEAGLCVPDDLPWESVLAAARPYLGTVHSGPSSWSPLSDRRQIFGRWSAEVSDSTDPWQFANFLVQ